MKFSNQLATGLSFGMTSGVITTLGLLVGLEAGTHSRLAVIGGILTIAVADALSDAFGIHAAEESEGVHTRTEVWTTAFFTFFAKFIFASTFVVPVLLFPLSLAVTVAVVWGLLLLTIFSLYSAKRDGEKPALVILEHTAIALLVIIATREL
jgi:VIT1/CCC1 family predicted Fe2+/Mn2+ transporter